MSAPPPPTTIPAPSENWAGGPQVAELAYASLERSRPWLVTGIGVASIVVAALSLLSALYSGLMLVPMLMFAGGTMTGGPGMASPTTPANTLTASEADVIVAALDAQAAIPPADQQWLSKALVAMETPLAPPADGKWTAAHVNNQLSGFTVSNFGGTSYTDYSLNSGGSINVSGGTISFMYWDATGNFVSSSYGTGGVSTTSTPIGMPGPTFSKLGIAIQVASFLLALALAVLLLVAGIQMLRGLPSGRMLHLWWAWPKIGAAALGAAAWYFWLNDFVGGIGGGASTWASLIFAGVSFAIAVAWPITVLILLRVRPVRAYFAEA